MHGAQTIPQPVSRRLLALLATAVGLGGAAASGARGSSGFLPLAEVAMVAVGPVLAAFALGGVLAGWAAAVGMASRTKGNTKGVLHAGRLIHLLGGFLVHFFIVCHVSPWATWSLGCTRLHEGVHELLGQGGHRQRRLW